MSEAKASVLAVLGAGWQTWQTWLQLRAISAASKHTLARWLCFWERQD